MEKLEKKLIEIIENESKKLENDSEIKDFSKADKEFAELVKLGFAARRGNNLLSSEDLHLRKYSINSKQNT